MRHTWFQHSTRGVLKYHIGEKLKNATNLAEKFKLKSVKMAKGRFQFFLHGKDLTLRNSGNLFGPLFAPVSTVNTVHWVNRWLVGR